MAVDGDATNLLIPKKSISIDVDRVMGGLAW